MKRIKIKILVTLLLSILFSSGMAQQKIGIKMHSFSDNSGSSINTPIMDFSSDIFGDMIMLVRYRLDRVSVPPIRGISASPSPIDAITGASRPITGSDPADQIYVKERHEVVSSFNSEHLGASHYFSLEDDYIAHMSSVFANLDFAQKNTNISFSYSFGWDDIHPIAADTALTKIAHAVNTTITQVLSPKMIVRIGADVSYISGFQSNPYRSVNAGGQIYQENHPVERRRGAVFLKLNRYFETESSINIDYRYYLDDWDIESHTAGFQYHQYLSKNALVRYRYRYYAQTMANFYKPLYPLFEEYITSDYKLEAFTSNLFGVKLEYKLKDLVKDGYLTFLSPSTFIIKYERYFTNKKYTANIYQIGLDMEF